MYVPPLLTLIVYVLNMSNVKQLNLHEDLYFYCNVKIYHTRNFYFVILTMSFMSKLPNFYRNIENTVEDRHFIQKRYRIVLK